MERLLGVADTKLLLISIFLIATFDTRFICTLPPTTEFL